MWWYTNACAMIPLLHFPSLVHCGPCKKINPCIYRWYKRHNSSGNAILMIKRKAQAGVRVFPNNYNILDLRTRYPGFSLLRKFISNVSASLWRRCLVCSNALVKMISQLTFEMNAEPGLVTIITSVIPVWRWN